jgi:hypothetical protein
MKRLVRNFVFETNSSSAHSVCVHNAMELLDTIEPNEDGEIILTGGDFGWSYKDEHHFTDAMTKANYLAVWAKCYARTESAKRTLSDIIKMHTGAEEVKYKFTGWTSFDDEEEEDVDSLPESYIDHQSQDSSFFETLFSEPTLMLKYLFNPKSFLTITGDGGDYPEEQQGFTLYRR